MAEVNKMYWRVAFYPPMNHVCTIKIRLVYFVVFKCSLCMVHKPLWCCITCFWESAGTTGWQLYIQMWLEEAKRSRMTKSLQMLWHLVTPNQWPCLRGACYWICIGKSIGWKYLHLHVCVTFTYHRHCDAQAYASVWAWGKHCKLRPL